MPGVDGARVEGVLHVVDLDRPPQDPADVLAALAQRVALVVGVARRPLTPPARRIAEALDLTLSVVPAGAPAVVPVDDLDDAVGLLEDAVARSPRAALVLGALLRTTSLLPVPEALAAEASAYSTLLAGPEHARWLAERGPARAVTDDDGDRVVVWRSGDVLYVRLTRAARRNAFDARMRHELAEALAVALADPALTVRITGEGPLFSSGGDLQEFGRLADPATAWVARLAEHPGSALHLLRARAHVHVHGACSGAGVELPAFAGKLTAAPDASFRLPELRMGLLPGAGGTVSLPRRIGRWRTAWLGLTGAALAAPDALAWGLVDGVHG
ncbi:MAG: hypothetical protein JWO60_3139 [Frankiales bacterium]|nr:hypothetical protein [Frankiales bacterium]